MVLACAACVVRPAALATDSQPRCLSSAELAQVAARTHAPTEEDWMTKLDAKLQILMRKMEQAAQQQARKSGAAPAAAAADSEVPCIAPKVEVTVYYTGSVDDLVAAGLELLLDSRDDHGVLVASGLISPTRLTELADIAHVVSIRTPGRYAPELSDSVPAIRVKALRQAHPEVTGAGVVVAIIDAGLDWKHGSFRDNTTGRTRLLGIWDLSLTHTGSEDGFAALNLFDPTKPRGPKLGVFYSKVKVAAMWHRADGPRLLRRLAVGTVEPDAPTPLRDDRDRAYLVRMFDQLRRHGSPSLQATLDRHQSLILRMLATPLAAQLAASQPA